MSLTKPEGMLLGDTFSLSDWKAARDLPSSLPSDLPNTVKIAMEEMQEACAHHGIPVVAIFALQDGIRTKGDLLSVPQNVPLEMLLARSNTAGDHKHQLNLMAVSLQGLDLSKFNL